MYSPHKTIFRPKTRAFLADRPHALYSRSMLLGAPSGCTLFLSLLCPLHHATTPDFGSWRPSCPLAPSSTHTPPFCSAGPCPDRAGRGHQGGGVGGRRAGLEEADPGPGGRALAHVPTGDVVCDYLPVVGPEVLVTGNILTPCLEVSRGR